MQQVGEDLQQADVVHELYPNCDVWQSDLSIITNIGSRKCKVLNSNVRLIDLNPQDAGFKFVLKSFDWAKEQSKQQGLDGFSRVKIKRVRLIYNESHQRQFGTEAFLLNQRQHNPIFAAKWRLMPRLEIRQKVYDLFEQQSKFYSKEALKFLPIWHGARAESLDGILTTGFANLATTDLGYYGKGIYGTSSCEYAKRVYSGGYDAQGILLLNWVSTYSALMVAGIEDIELLKGKGNYANYDSHFIPVVPRNFYYHKLGVEDIYFPMQLTKDIAVYDEMVVFGSRQILARYIVETSFDACSPDKPFSVKDLLNCLPDSSRKLEPTFRQLLDNINSNPWLPDNYINLSYLLKNNQTIALPLRAEEVLERLPDWIRKLEYDAVNLCQIGLYLNNNYIPGYHGLAEALKNKPSYQQKALLAFPVDKLCSRQDLYKAAIECLDRRFQSSDSDYFRCKSNFLARLSILTLDSSKQRDHALQAIDIDSNNAMAWIALGNSLAKNERIEFKHNYYSTKELFLKALQLEPSSFRALLGLAKSLMDRETIKVQDKLYDAKDLLKMILEHRADCLEALDELWQLKQRLYIDDEDLRNYLINKLQSILVYYIEHPKVWLWLSNCLHENEVIWIGNEEYSYSQILHRAFLLDPTNIGLYSKLTTGTKESMDFSLLEGKVRGNYQSEAKELQSDLDLYVPVLATSMDPCYYQYSEEYLLDLKEYVLNNDNKNIWIYGETGSSKTMFARHLENYLWEQYLDTKKMPFYINRCSNNVVEETLKLKNFNDAEISSFLKEIKVRGIELIFIVDNYNGVMFNSTENQRFILLSSNRPKEHFINRCVYIVPFTNQQVRSYMYSYVRSTKYNSVGWSINRYEYGLDLFNIRELSKEPLLLKLILSIMPKCLKFSKDQNTKQEKIESQVTLQAFTKFDVYKMFINIFIEQKMVTAKYYQKYQNYFTKEQVLIEVAEYARSLAWSMMINNSHTIKWQVEEEHSYYEVFFESARKAKRRLLKICYELLPINIKQDIRQGRYKCSFLHGSFKDYFIAVNIIEQLNILKEVNNIEVNNIECLNQSIIDDSSLRIFLVDEVTKNYELQRKLLEIVYLSKHNAKFEIAAANAITLLNDAKFSFAGLDLSYIKVSWADLRLANLDHTKLSYALLDNTKLHGAYLGFTQLDWANLSNVELGELPAILLEEPIRDCGMFGEQLYVVSTKKFIIYNNTEEGWVVDKINMTPSSQYEFISGGLLANGVSLTLNKQHIIDFKKPEKFDGVGAINVWHVVVMAIKDNILAVGLEDGKIIVYDALASQGKYIYRGLYNQKITALCWGDNDLLFAGGLTGGVFKLLKENNYKVCQTQDITALVTKRDLLVVGLLNGQLLLFDNEIERLKLTCHEQKIINIILNGQIIFSNSVDGRVCFWEISTGQCLKILNYSNKINRMVLLGKYLGTASEDGSLRFWDLKESKGLAVTRGKERPLFCDGAYFAESKGLTKIQIAVIKQTGGYNKPPYIWKLFRACKEGNVAAVLSLLGEGISINLRNSKGFTPLGVAAKEGHKLLVESLVPLVEDRDSPLFYAASNNKEQVISSLIVAKANIEARHNIAGSLVTSLYIAVSYGYVQVVRELLKHKANINFVKQEVNGDGDTILGIAARENKAEVCEVLLQEKADINQQSKLGRTALWNAAYNGHNEIVDLLLSYKATVDLGRIDNGTTPFFMAAQGGHSGIVEKLIIAKANINQMRIDSDKMITPLYVAARNDHRTIVAKLLDHDADLYEVSNGKQLINAGKRALSVAKEHDREEIIQMLERRGVKIDKDGSSPNVFRNKVHVARVNNF